MKKYIGLIIVPIAIGMLPLIASAQLVITAGNYVVLSGGTGASPTTLVLTNPLPAAITNPATGWIISESEYNQVQWNIGTNTGTYTLPFGVGMTYYLPVTCDISTAGAGSGVVKFSTYHGTTWDNALYEPSDVTTLTDFGAADYSVNMVDRFWEVDANTGYSTKPTVSNLTFTYISGGVVSEAATPNYIVNAALIAQRFNSTLSAWDDFTGSTGTYANSGNTSTISSGLVGPTNLFRSWVLANDSTLVTSVAEVSNKTDVITYPNPTHGVLTIEGVKPGQVIELYNYLGQNLSTVSSGNSNTIQLDLSNKANGVYLLRIENKDGSLVTTRKIVKTQ
jgi:hypothetical protein